MITKSRSTAVLICSTANIIKQLNCENIQIGLNIHSVHCTGSLCCIAEIKGKIIFNFIWLFVTFTKKFTKCCA